MDVMVVCVMAVAECLVSTVLTMAGGTRHVRQSVDDKREWASTAECDTIQDLVVAPLPARFRGISWMPLPFLKITAIGEPVFDLYC